MVPTLVENSKFFVCTCLLTFFVNNFIMTGEPTHTASEMAQRTSAPYRLKSELSIMLHCQLCSGPGPRDFEWSGQT